MAHPTRPGETVRSRPEYAPSGRTTLLDRLAMCCEFAPHPRLTCEQVRLLVEQQRHIGSVLPGFWGLPNASGEAPGTVVQIDLRPFEWTGHPADPFLRLRRTEDGTEPWNRREGPDE